MYADVKQWGNSMAVRLSARDLRRLGVQLGDRVEVTVKPVPRGKGNFALPAFHDQSGARDVSERHDDYLYGDA